MNTTQIQHFTALVNANTGIVPPWLLTARAGTVKPGTRRSVEDTTFVPLPGPRSPRPTQSGSTVYRPLPRPTEF